MAYANRAYFRVYLNPAVTIGLYAGGRIKANEVLPYIVSQVLGAIAGQL